MCAAPEFFLAKDRARRVARRIALVVSERKTAFAGDRVGMTSFADASLALLAIEDDVTQTIGAILDGRLRDRERGETEIPLVVALEGVRERVERARRIEEARRDARAAATWAEPRFFEILNDAMRRLNAFCEAYDAKRIVGIPAATDVAHTLSCVERDAAIDATLAARGVPSKDLGAVTSAPPPHLLTAADALEDLLRAARAEVPSASLPWAVATGAGTPLRLTLQAAASAIDGEPPDGKAAADRTKRAVDVLAFAHLVSVERIASPEGGLAAIAVLLEDRTAAGVGSRVSPEAKLSPVADAAVRTYLVAAAEHEDPLAPPRLVAAMGLFRAVDRELDRVLSAALSTSAVRFSASRIPREATRKAPVRREALEAVSAAIPGFPVQRATDVLDAIAAGKSGPGAAHPPDVAVVLAILGRHWQVGGGFGERVLPLGSLSDDDVLASARDAIVLGDLRQSLERGRDPGPGWTARLEGAAFGLLRRLAQIAM